jgi:hypothetical protein
MRLAPLLLLLAACSSSPISSTFEGGSIGAVEKRGENHYACRVPGQADQDGRNRQVTWYSFRLDGHKGREVKITLTDLAGEYDYKPGAIGINGEAPPMVSRDGQSWKHLPAMSFDRAKAEATFTFVPESDPVWVSHIEPYTVTRLQGFLRGLAGRPEVRTEVIGKSVEGRDLYLLTITNPAVGDDGKKVIWLMCRQHAWESGTSYVGEGAVRFLISDDARGLRDQVVWKILPMMDPDGVFHGGVRFNRNGYDINRNWDTADSADEKSRRLMPEICAAKQALQGQRIDFFLTLHNQEKGGWTSGSEKYADLAARFFKILKDETIADLPGDGPRPPGARPAAGRQSVYQYLQLEKNLPGFILEQGISKDEKLGRLPTSHDRLKFGGELVRSMAKAVLGK